MGCCSQVEPATFILKRKPAAVIVETAVTPKHGSATGNVFDHATDQVQPLPFFVPALWAWSSCHAAKAARLAAGRQPSGCTKHREPNGHEPCTGTCPGSEPYVAGMFLLCKA